MTNAPRRLSDVVLGARPLQRRLTFLTMLAVGLTVLVTCLTGWLALRATLYDISERGSLQMAQDLAPRAVEDLGRLGRLGPRLLGTGTTVVQAVGPDGTVLSVRGEALSLDLGRPEVAAAQEQRQTVRNTTSSDGEVYRLVTVPLGEEGYVLVVGRPLASSEEVLNVFGLVVLLVGGIGVVWAWLLGRTVAGTAFQPVRRFTEAVRHVAETEDLEPVSPESGGGDLAALTETFNLMLCRIALSRDQQRRLVADAGHELRTPLTSVRTNLELLGLDTAGRRLSDEQRGQVVAEALDRTVELSTLVSELVHLARESVPAVREPLDLSDVVEAAVGRVRDRTGVGFDLRLTPTVLVGDAGALERAVGHLLENAVTWSPPGGTVHVRLVGHRLEVADEGPGIAEADLPHVFDRFYRSEAARSTAGHGLGLALATKAFGEHGGTLAAGRAPEGGALFTVALPGSAGAPGDGTATTTRLLHVAA
ncbi:HAMP domain-containing sensor histidine kinase [Microlunatus spumicola]|uniref:histidine kinase n=1 Tax=Microlunatus spumicola TaxID=81499 RepID=A0ABP6WIL7_9ACTN